MSDEEMKTIYEMSKSIYEGKSDLTVCGKIVLEKYGRSERSFEGWFVPLFRYMLRGEPMKGCVPQSLVKYYLERIYIDYGLDALKNALKSYKGTIDYYEKERCEKKPGDNKIYESFLKLIDESVCKKTINYSIAGELDETDVIDVEGLRKSVFVNIYERSADARLKCIQKKGTVCAVCGFDFEETYGELGKGFIHIHHIIPIASIGKSYKINYDTDLIPVCPNCHAMLHRGKNGTPLSIKELKNIIKK